MDKNKIDYFIEKFREAFGDYVLPIVFCYSDEEEISSVFSKGCFIGELGRVLNGEQIVFSKDNLTCGGGKVYCGFSEPLPHIPNFVSKKEKYKKTPEMVEDFLRKMNLSSIVENKIVFERIDKVKNPEKIIGVIFFATPDVLTGLISWTFYDTNISEAVSVPFGSGCSSIIAQTYLENRKNGKRCFLGMFDPSARPQVNKNTLTYSIPMSRFSEMVETIDECCLTNSNAWIKVKERINSE